MATEQEFYKGLFQHFLTPHDRGTIDYTILRFKKSDGTYEDNVKVIVRRDSVPDNFAYYEVPMGDIIASISTFSHSEGKTIEGMIRDNPDDVRFYRYPEVIRSIVHQADIASKAGLASALSRFLDEYEIASGQKVEVDNLRVTLGGAFPGHFDDKTPKP